MDRRRALKNIGLGAGFLVATPTIMSLLQSCESKPVFTPVYLSMGEGNAVREIVGLIIPSDQDIPGAVDVGVHEFIDAYLNEVAPEAQQTIMKLQMGALAEKFQSEFGKGLEDGSAEEFDQILANYLKADKTTQEGYDQKMEEFYGAVQSDPNVKPDTDAAVFGLLTSIRGMTIWAWKSSEAIGKNVLWYDPVPGQQIGCIPLKDANGGKAMAL